ncbi:hypothetical protein M405DRAFT_855074 [Rhizopogon salebrosus TDB-379]|nr:hypothetical protein M405DRAFT_855074 [Rhizopogon salebrosus TDB-379]
MSQFLLLPTNVLPSYRHASPSGPWPWMDFSIIDFVTATAAATAATATTNDSHWQGYPQNLFGNWAPEQVERSQMLTRCSENCTLYCMDVLDDGSFISSPIRGDDDADMLANKSQDECWNIFQQTPENIQVRLLFVDDLTSYILKMLGTRYNIEPFFFTSSINWIPSRYQEALIHGKGDHITITLPFVRTSQSDHAASQSYRSHPTADNQIDTQEPLKICSMCIDLVIDLLAIHMVREIKTSTIIYYHPGSKLPSAKRLRGLMLLVGESVYWKNIFSKSKDPTFLLLAILWYALYTWDESFESLYKHVSKLESDVLTESRVEHTGELHILQAYLLHYESLLHGFQVSVSFIENTPNPGMESAGIYGGQRKVSNELMKKECENLVGEIDRLQKRREMLSNRLRNVMNLAFANVNIKDSASTRQVPLRSCFPKISYLTTIFLPASLVASVFGMNIKEINPGTLWTLVRYIEITIGLTLFTVYVVVTLQTHTFFHKPGARFWERAIWPILLIWKILNKGRMYAIPCVDMWEKHRRAGGVT